MKSSDIIIGGVYRYTYSGPSASALNKRGPWLVGTVVGHPASGSFTVEPVPGLPIARSRPPAGITYATPPAVGEVHVTRLDGRLTDRSTWDMWLNQYLLEEARNAQDRVVRAQAARAATIRLVAALMTLGHDVGRGPWDRSTPWGQFVDDLRRREMEIIETTSEAFNHLAGDPSRAVHAEAEAWYTRTIS